MRGPIGGPPGEGEHSMAAVVVRNEVQGLTEVVGQAVVGASHGLEQVHDAVVGRACRAAGLLGTPVRAVHDLVTGGVYGSLRLGLVVGATAGGTMAGLLSEATGMRSVSHHRVGGTALALLNGLAGSHLERAGNHAALPMAIRLDGRDVPVDAAGLREAYPAATGDVVVFIHGLFETERSWTWGAARTHGDPNVTYGSRLAVERDITAVHLRYNTGLRIAENGRQLDALLDALVASWPVPVERVALVGHSMGGLVIRSACHVGLERGAAWVDRVRHAVYLGSPHLGAPLARTVKAAGALLRRLPETRPLGTVLHQLSDGIDDLRHGALVDHDVIAADPPVAEATAAEQRREWLDPRDVPLLEGCRHHAVSATLAPRSGTVLDRLVGDLLVQTTSATGTGHRRRRVDFVAEEGLSVGGAHHLSLLNHPAVYDQLRAWLDED
jgi:pimeloyl-ACP methyl ester carboxylesterase